MLSWGVYATLWTAPNDQGSIIQTILNNESDTFGYRGPTGNGTVIPPGSQIQYIMMFPTNPTSGHGASSFLLPKGLGIMVGPFPMSTSSSLTSIQKNYAIFTTLFYSRVGSGNFTSWLSGPQGNLTFTYATSKYGGVDFFTLSPFASVSTSILELPGPGNYTLHYLNRNTSANVTGQVSLGASTATYTQPYFYSGLTTIALGAGLAVATILDQKNKAKVSEPVS